jgi:RNA polymerase sigma-70 factor (ECF subfamily)
MDIKTLLNLVSDDDRESFNTFYHLYYDRVFRFAYYFLKDKEACREVVADVFFSIWKYRKKLKKIENIETYLYIVVRNEANRFFASRANYNYVSLQQIPVHLESSSDNSPEDNILILEMEELLAKIINELPEKCRLIFLMSREKGMKPKQIAEILSIKESTVRVQMKIATEKIIFALKQYFPHLALILFIAMIIS